MILFMAQLMMAAFPSKVCTCVQRMCACDDDGGGDDNVLMMGLTIS